MVMSWFVDRNATKKEERWDGDGLSTRSEEVMVICRNKKKRDDDDENW